MTQQRVTLQIFREDGSIYWTEYFNSLDEANNWLEVEKTRFYWDPTYDPKLHVETFDSQPIFPINGES